ncbi:MAG: hypothetical protein ACQKBU_09275 [Verrucomicrobiales bacterium]
MKNPHLFVLAFATTLAFSDAQDTSLDFETAPVLEASRTLEPALLRGPHHRVREHAPSDGYLTHYTMDSDFGVFTCVGRRELERRILELQAIEKLTEVSKSDLFAEGLKRSVEAPIDAVKNIASDPEKAIKQAPKTVGHFFSKVSQSVGNTARRVGKRFDDEPKEDVDWAQTGKGISTAAKSVAGFDQAKLDTARQLGVDPYTDNSRLQDEIEKVTWAFFAGGLPLRVGAAAVSGGASAALTVTTTVGIPEDIYDTTPSELAFRDREALTSMGVDDQTLNELFLNPSLTVSLRHGIVQSLRQLPSGPGQVEIIRLAHGLPNPRQVTFLNQALATLVERHRQAPYQEVNVFGRLPAGLTADGYLEVPAPVDEVFWTEQVAGFAAREDLAISKRRLLLDGSLSATAHAGFKHNGWEIVSRP